MPDESTIPDDEYGAAVRRGLQIANHTYKELPDNVGNQLNCTSCHLGNGSEAYAAPWNNMTSIYPVYRSRAGRINVIQERINGCFERSMNGKALELGSDDMNAMVSYMSWLSKDLPFGVSPEGRGFVEVDKQGIVLAVHKNIKQSHIPIVTGYRAGSALFVRGCRRRRSPGRQGAGRGSPARARRPARIPFRK